MTRVLLLALLTAGPPPAKDAPTRAPTEKMTPRVKGPTHAGASTKCSACHSTSAWTEVRFNHDRTGFALTGAHANTSCKACHTVDFRQPLARTCAACHRDVHAGELGARCDSCHETETWRSRFDAEAHRRTNFPLLGAHGALPCVECHLEARERRFSRAAVDCVNCHQRDFERTRGSAIDHLALSLDPQQCRDCHGGFRFSPARFPAHDRCFLITGGPHAAIGCFNCHITLSPRPPEAAACSTGTASCSSCHEHECSVTGSNTHTDQLHANVQAYQCKDRLCYECHQKGGL